MTPMKYDLNNWGHLKPIMPRTLIVHTRDKAFANQVQQTLEKNEYIIKVCTNSSMTIEQLLSTKNVILLIDVETSGHDISDLRTVYQNLTCGQAVILAGNRERSESLLEYIDHGVGYRLVFKPVVPGQLKLSFQAAEKKLSQFYQDYETHKKQSIRLKEMPSDKSQSDELLDQSPEEPLVSSKEGDQFQAYSTDKNVSQSAKLLGGGLNETKNVYRPLSLNENSNKVSSKKSYERIPSHDDDGQMAETKSTSNKPSEGVNSSQKNHFSQISESKNSGRGKSMRENSNHENSSRKKAMPKSSDLKKKVSTLSQTFYLPEYHGLSEEMQEQSHRGVQHYPYWLIPGFVGLGFVLLLVFVSGKDLSILNKAPKIQTSLVNTLAPKNEEDERLTQELSLAEDKKTLKWIKSKLTQAIDEKRVLPPANENLLELIQITPKLSKILDDPELLPLKEKTVMLLEEKVPHLIKTGQLAMAKQVISSVHRFHTEHSVSPSLYHLFDQKKKEIFEESFQLANKGYYQKAINNIKTLGMMDEPEFRRHIVELNNLKEMSLLLKRFDLLVIDGFLVGQSNRQVGAFELLQKAIMINPMHPQVIAKQKKLVRILEENLAKDNVDDDLKRLYQTAFFVLGGNASPTPSVEEYNTAVAERAEKTKVVERKEKKPQQTVRSRSSDLPNVKSLSAEDLLLLAAEANQRERLTVPPRRNATYYYAIARDHFPNHPGVIKQVKTYKSQILQRLEFSLVDGDLSQAQKWVAVLNKLGDNRAIDESIWTKGGGSGLIPLTTMSEPEKKRIRAETLLLTHYVPPKFPNLASEEDGWVELEFTISSVGDPVDIRVVDADPPRVFNKSAVDALSLWRYQPIKSNGLAQEQPAVIRLIFKR